MIFVQGTALEALAYTPHSNMLDAYWQRTAAILARKPDQADADSEQEGEDGEQSEQSGKSPAAQALAASQREAIAGPARLVALQVGTHLFSHTIKSASQHIGGPYTRCGRSGCMHIFTRTYK